MPRYIHPDIAHLPPHEEIILAWNAHQWIPRKKSWIWWLFAALTTIVIGGLGLYFNLIALTVLVVVMVIYLGLSHRTAPKIETMALTRSGIWIDERLIPYEEIEEFRTVFIGNHKDKSEDRPQVNTLELSLKNLRVIEIELYTLHPEEVREIMRQFVPESRYRSIWNYWLVYLLKL